MNININYVLKDLQGKDIHVDEKPLTAKEIIITVLLRSNENQYNSYMLAKKISDDESEEIDLSSEDITYIKSTLMKDKGYIALVTGQVIELLK